MFYDTMKTDTQNIGKSEEIKKTATIIELDIFSGIYEKLAFAEIEYKSEEQAKSTKIPEWFGKEISSIVTNSEMAMTPSDVIFDKLKNL